MAEYIPTSSLPPFDIAGPAHAVAVRWRKWKRSFEYFISARGITDKGRKRCTLLHMAGLAVQDVFDTLTEVTDPDDDEFERAVKTLDGRFEYVANHRYERFVFRNMTVASGESYDQFVSRLRMQAAHCKFSDTEDVLCDQLLLCVRDSKLRKDLLEEKELKLEKALELARRHEETTHTLREMSSAVPSPLPTPFPAEDIAAIRERPGQQDCRNSSTRDRDTSHPSSSPASGKSASGKCGNCGRSGHSASAPSCPARGKACNRCARTGHFGAVCRSGPSQERAQASRRTANQILYDSGSDEEYAFAAGTSYSLSQTVQPIVLGDTPSQCLVDSGASCNLIGQSELLALVREGLRVSVRNSRKRVVAYGNAPLDVVGEFVVETTVNHTTLPTLFVVIKGSGQLLLGRPSSLAFGALLLPQQVNSAQSPDPFRSDLEQKYSRVFTGIGRLTDYEARIHVDESVRPVPQRPRRIAFALERKVKAQIQELLDADLIEEVQGPTTWVSPVVVRPKANGDVRICVDMRRANEAVIRQRYPMPTVDEVLEKVNGATCFSKIDLRMGFHQVMLEENSRDITTFAVDSGIYRFKRLMFGISSAPELYQHIIQQVICGCPGAMNIADDIIVFGATAEEHDRNLHLLLQRLQDRGLTVNPRKCSFRRSEISFFGFTLSDTGVQAATDKIDAVVSAPAPSNASQTRSFLGLVGFSARFIPNLSTIAEPLRRVTHTGVTFVWAKEQQEAFQEIKSLLTSAPALAYYSTSAPTEVIADASPVGLGAVLVQVQDGVRRAVGFVSRTLSPVERRYSQTEREALGLVWACERFRQFLFGRHFTLVTDHKPLQAIYSPTSRPSARVERWVLRLQSFDFDVRYIPGPSNIADALSRMPVPDNSARRLSVEESVRLAVSYAAPAALSIREIERASHQDPELVTIRRCISSGNWATLPPAYKQVRLELTTVGRVVLRGTQIVIPASLRSQVVDLAHEGHQGITKMKARLRTKVWWPGIGRDAEVRCRSCHGCQVTATPSVPAPVKSTILPAGPWLDLATDLMGPLPSGHYLLVTVDYYSRFFEVDVLRTVTSRTVIGCLEAHFARHGVPTSLRTDNGPQFASAEFVTFLQAKGVRHVRTTPLWPRANGEVERQNRTLLKTLQIAHATGKAWREELVTFLLAYRSTPHTVTGVPPAQLLYNRPFRCKLPAMLPDDSPEQVVLRDAERKAVSAQAADIDRRAADTGVGAGDRVLLQRNQRGNKLSATFHPQALTVVNRNGDQLLLRTSEGTELRRNVQQTKIFVSPTPDAGSGSSLSSPPPTHGEGDGESAPAPTRRVQPPREAKSNPHPRYQDFTT